MRAAARHEPLSSATLSSHLKPHVFAIRCASPHCADFHPHTAAPLLFRAGSTALPANPYDTVRSKDSLMGGHMAARGRR